MMDAINFLVANKMISGNPAKQLIASVSVGIFEGHAVLDLDYAEDSNAETDMNVVMTESGGFIEVQGTGEDGDFSHDQLLQMLALGNSGIQELIAKQRQALS